MYNLYKSVAIISNDCEYTDILYSIVENLGCSVIVQLNLASALESFQRELPHILILNISQIKSDAVIAFLKYRKQNSRLKKIMIFLYVDRANKKNAEKYLVYGADELLTLPLKSIELVPLLKKYLNSDSVVRGVHYKDSKTRPTLNTQIYAELIKYSEIGCIIESSVKFLQKGEIKIDSSLFDSAGHREINVLYQTIGHSQYIKSKIYRTKIIFKGENEKSNKTMRALNWNK
jgi:DNA-binding response OmpR family regulator